MMFSFEQPDETWTRWRDVFRSIVEYTAQPEENIDDIFAGCFALGQRRARVRNQPFNILEDLPFGLAMWCWWPFKDPLLEDNRLYLMELRKQLFVGARSDENVVERFTDVVPDDVLKLNLYQLFEVLHTTDLRGNTAAR